MASNKKKSGKGSKKDRSIEQELNKRSRAKELMGKAAAQAESLPDEDKTPTPRKKKSTTPTPSTSDSGKKRRMSKKLAALYASELEEGYTEEEAYKRARKKLHRKKGWNFLRRFMNFCIALGLAGACVVASFIIYYAQDLPSTDKLFAGPSSPPITVLARDGSILGVLGGFYGKPLTYEAFPKHLVEAVLATEDRKFFSHFGIDPHGMARAIVANYRAGHVVQGASTITQQLAKVVFLSSEKNLKRKIQEMLLAFWLEYHFTKEEILAMYLNRVYLGAGNYGVDAASQQYFGKPVTQITLHEAATLAGLLKAPSRYSPFNNPQKSQERTRQVLLNMVDAGFITQEEADNQPTKLQNEEAFSAYNKGRYFVDWIGSLIPEYVAVPEDGVKVLTTLDPKLQGHAETAVKAHTEKFQGALVSMNSKGEILAMVGGRNYKESQFNRAAQSQRQPGSSFKFFVYLAAMELGYSPDTIMTDEPIAIKDFAGWWRPQNYHNDYLGAVTLQDAFAKSINTVAVKLSEAIGRDRVIEMTRRLGITAPIRNTPSLPLGTNEVTLVEMVQAYAHMASNGRQVQAYPIQEIRAEDGQVIYRHVDYDMPQILDTSTVAKMNRLLMAVTRYGTAQTAKFGRPVGGKTGTTQEHRDGWFVGYTPQFITGAWVGKDDNTSLGKVTGGTVPATIFREYMEKAHEGLPIEEIPTSGGAIDGGIPVQQLPASQQPQDEPPSMLMRWFGFGSAKNRPPQPVQPQPGMPQPQPVNPSPAGENNAPAEAPRPNGQWDMPDGEVLTPQFKRTAPINRPYVPERILPPEGQVPAATPPQQAPASQRIQEPSQQQPIQNQPVRTQPAQQQPVRQPPVQQENKGIFDDMVPDFLPGLR